MPGGVVCCREAWTQFLSDIIGCMCLDGGSDMCVIDQSDSSRFSRSASSTCVFVCVCEPQQA